MSTMREKILALLAEGEQPAAALIELGCRSVVQKHLQLMVMEGEIYKFGRARNTSYSLHEKPRFPAKKVQALVLPDIPPIMQWWGGYTDKVPNPDHGEFYYGS